jgi:hypothetical protein
MPDELRRELTKAAFIAAGSWIVFLAWLESRGRTQGRLRWLFLAAPALALLAAIAALIYL